MVKNIRKNSICACTGDKPEFWTFSGSMNQKCWAPDPAETVFKDWGRRDCVSALLGKFRRDTRFHIAPRLLDLLKKSTEPKKRKKKWALLDV